MIDKLLLEHVGLPQVLDLDVHLAWMGIGDHSETVLLLALFDQSTPSWIKVIGWGGGGGGVVAHVILVSALGPNPSFFPFLGDFYSTWGPVGTGARTWTWTRA